MKRKSKKSSKQNAAKEAAHVRKDEFGPDRTRSGSLKGTKSLGQSKDPTFAWVRSVCRHDGDAETPMEQWRALGEKYMAQLSSTGQGSYRRALTSLRMFFEHYAWRHQIYNPEDLLTLPTDANPPPLWGPKGSGTPYRDSSDGLKVGNCLHDFLTWVIETGYSSDEDGYPVPIPGFHVPFDRLSSAGTAQPDETVRGVVPYQYMCDLRDLLAPGTDFRDWKWAQGATRSKSGKKSGEWFEVDKSEIDENDPDCVWRGPETVRILNYQLPEHERRKNLNPYMIVGTREVYYIWSPVTAVALLTKLEMPWRTFQVRMLDSGEADASCVELDPDGEKAFLNAQQGNVPAPGSADGIDPDTKKTSLVQKNLFRWVENPERTSLLAGLTRDQRGRVRAAQGVFLPCEEARIGKFVGFFINTNKTADADKDWHLRGYRVHYQHSSLLRWLVKLRNWQKKYNPLRRPTLWTELEPKHTELKSGFNLQAAAPTCFLFRDASARGKRDGDHAKPIADNMVVSLWTKLLTSLENQKKDAGETDADGNPMRLIQVHRKNVGSSRPVYPLHSLRVSWISNLADAGMKLELLMKLAGHTRLVMTIYYRKINAWQMAEGMRESQEKLAKRGDEYTLRVLKGNAYEQMPKHIVADQESLQCAVPRNPSDRTSSGWLRLLGGWCLMGGNIHPSADRKRCGGCFNGGPEISERKEKRQCEYASVKPLACIECKCRWFVTRPEYLLEIRAKMMLLADQLHAVQRHLSQHESELHELKIERARHAKAHPDQLLFPRLAELRKIEHLVEKLSADSQTLTVGIGNAANLADRVIAVELLDESGGEKTQLVAQGSQQDVRWAFEAANSELLALADICSNAEIYPELEPESESSVLRLGQVLDVSLQKQGMGMVFARLTPEQQLRLGNRFIREVARPLHDHLAAAVAMIERGQVRHSAEILRKLIEEGKYAPTPILQLLENHPVPLSPSPSPQQPAA